MTGSARPTGEWLLAFLRENAFAIMVAIFAFYSWFQSSNATLAGKVERLEAEVSAYQATIGRQRIFNNHASNQLNYLCATAAACRQLYSPIVAPE